MAKVIRTRGQKQQQIVKLANILDGKYNRWDIWQDFILMFSTSIANIFPGPYRKEREAAYLKTAKQYTDEELETFADMMALVVDGMEEDPEQDFLGELFMAMELGNNRKGQFFTPYEVCQMMAKITIGSELAARCEQQNFISVSDPACGAGALLIAFANECKRIGVNYQQKCLFVAQDIDFLAGMMCYIQLSLMGCAGYVVIDDTISKPALFYDKKGLLPAGGSNVWILPMTYTDIWQVRQITARMDLMIQGNVSKAIVPEIKPESKNPKLIHITIPELKADATGQLTLF